MKQSRLEELLDTYSVLDDWDGQAEMGLTGWYCVVGPDDVLAYFQSSVWAYRYRLDLINNILNPL